MNYAVRLSRSFEAIQNHISILAMASEKLLVYEHNENVERVHCHIHINGYSKSEDALETWIKTVLNMNKMGRDASKKTQYKPYGKKQSQPIDDGNISYMSKGKYDPVYNKGYDQDYVNDLKAKGYDKKTKEKESKTTDESLYREFVEMWLDPKLSDHWQQDKYDFREVKKAIWAYCKAEFGVCININFLNKYNMLCRTFYFDQPVDRETMDKESVEKLWKPIL